MSGNSTPQQGSLPAASVRLALEATIGPDEAARALQNIGQDLADRIFDRLTTALQDDPAAEGRSPAQLDETDFWERLAQIFADLGWGGLTFSELHPGVGLLESHDWAEANPESASLRPSCHTTVALLANLLGRIADAEIGVLEVACRSRGDLDCRFIFGGRGALGGIYAGLRTGVSLEDLIEDLV